MNYVVVGINHKSAPVNVREKFALDTNKAKLLLKRLYQGKKLRELAVISTCNRVELYGVSGGVEEAKNELYRVFYQSDMVDEKIEWDSYIYTHENKEAISHLFSVTSSLDSLILGENQITKQVRDAYDLATHTEVIGPYLNQLFHKAFFVAKRVKTETDISKGNISVGSAGVLLAKKIFGKLTDKKVLLLGAGEIGELVVRYLNDLVDSGNTFIMNRTLSKAQNLEVQNLGIAKDFQDFEEVILEADIVVSSMSAGYEFLDQDLFKKIMTKRKNRSLFVIDLGVPRNIDETVGELSNLYLYNVDDLKEISEENKQARLESLNHAKNIIEHEANDFYDSFIGQKARPTIASLSQKFDRIRDNEVEKSLTKMQHLSDDDKKIIEKMSKAIVSKILHDPIFLLKNEEELSEPGVLEIVKKIFKLNDEEIK